ncbi:16S rRNA (guanine(527)-N(7))-methyltransferase RsmG [Sphingomonas nostoxanthinifaciens]|uniref:16S rRNA (guanine(527)-N(7))-methyltransferase RsmG n=1 Tax=Sphingomonas nostoxanthinifaciens TaxID=2872652 RepID=UPI001CC1FAC8|nr:16S rRNA (guanine(527)-N(7))-methyltransferase RsmG [Sphingomonas nostoxanthinifaciens]UAK24655.1 16S rRNA (guanine(527)-N(7))-methyltransferase RsmG [Sphingomonas nostoxanthinifaciens]
MNEEEARAYIAAGDVPRETLDRLDAFVALLADENERQNLIAASTLPLIWSRHIVDSAQLIQLAPSEGAWLDLGSGPGFPGLIVAALTNRPTILVEERARRVAFLHAAAAVLDVKVDIRQQRVERASDLPPIAVISARAFAPLPRLFAVAAPLANKDTVWVLPKGRSAAAELEEAAATWQGDFRIEPSVTDPEAAIIVARAVRAKGDR